MGQGIQRYFAMVCAAAALVCVATWLLSGAPNVPHINLLTDPATDAYQRQGYYSVAWFAIWGLGSVSPLAAHLVLFMLSMSVATAATLSLILLIRSDKTNATSQLGIGLGLWSLSVAYLGIFAVAPTFAYYESWPFSLRVVLDMAAFLLLLAAAYAVVHFWEGFPRPVAVAPVRLGPGLRKSKMAAMVLLICALGFIWRGGWYLPLDDLGDLAADIVQWSIALVILCSIAALVWPVLLCIRLLRFHRSFGTPEDRARIEWIWTAVWIALILCLLPAVMTPALWLAAHWFPELDFDFGWVGMYLLLALFSSPFIVLIALALSVFYRGAIDPRLALKGFTVWTLLGVVLTLIFVFIERTVATRLVLLMHLPPQTGYVTAGAIVAATFQPIRKRMERGVNRFVERVLPEKLLASGKRETAAVAVVDIAGFTALSAKDEQAAILASALLQKEARRLADAHGGRVVKSTGDGVILLFQEPGLCLTALQELHHSVAQRAGALDLPPLALHSGANWGEVVEMHDGDIYGMTVNVAARIADWAQAGEIGISETLGVALPAPAAGFEPQGPQRFKNVPEPVVCLKRVLAW